MKRIRFTVTQENIERGDVVDPCGCPIALALNEATGDSWVVVPTKAWRRAAFQTYTLARSGVRFQARLFKDKPVEPFTGEVYQ